MKRISTVCFLMFLFISCTRTIYYSSDWQSNKVTADGLIPEWSSPLRFYSDKTQLNYTVSNDEDNLYLCCSITDEFLQTKILISGIEFGIDTLGGKDFPVRFKFPVADSTGSGPESTDNQPAVTGNKGRSDPYDFKQRLISHAKVIRLKGFKPSVSKIISMSGQNETGIMAAINLGRTGIMNYEAVIPFSTFYKSRLSASDTGTIFNYLIKIDRMPKSALISNQHGTQNRGMRRSGTGDGNMRGGGMRNGGMRGGGMRDGGMRGEGMRSNGTDGGAMGGGMDRNEMDMLMGENGTQGNAVTASTTKTTFRLKLAFR